MSVKKRDSHNLVLSKSLALKQNLTRPLSGRSFRTPKSGSQLNPYTSFEANISLEPRDLVKASKEINVLWKNNKSLVNYGGKEGRKLNLNKPIYKSAIFTAKRENIHPYDLIAGRSKVKEKEKNKSLFDFRIKMVKSNRSIGSFLKKDLKKVNIAKAGITFTLPERTFQIA